MSTKNTSVIIKFDFSNNTNYKRAIRFASDEQKAELKRILASISHFTFVQSNQPQIDKLKKKHRRQIIWGCIFLVIAWPIALIILFVILSENKWHLCFYFRCLKMRIVDNS